MMKKSSLALVLIWFAILGWTQEKAELPMDQMQIYASPDQLQSLLKRYPNRSFLLFPESRENPIRLFDGIPSVWAERGDSELNSIQLIAQPGEYLFFQIGVWAFHKDLSPVELSFTDFTSDNGDMIPAGKWSCINTGGIDFNGNPFVKEVHVQKHRVLALWMGIDLAKVNRGTYTGMVKVTADGDPQTVAVTLHIDGVEVPDHGYNDGTRLSRLNWLNSIVGIDEEITKEYLPIQVESHTVSILGRTLEIAPNGLPAAITSFFSPSNQFLKTSGEPIVDHPFRFIAKKHNGEIISLVPGELKITQQTPSIVVWEVVNSSDEFDLLCTGQMEYDGFVDYHLKIIPKTRAMLKDIRLEIPVVQDKAIYMMGLGHEGGFRTPEWKWKWDVTKNQDMLWVGGVNGGLRIKWKAENYVRPLINIYYKFGPLAYPPSWWNSGNGGVNVVQKNREVVVSSYSGTRELNPGEELNYDFELLITPLKIIDRQIKFTDRYYHGGGTNTTVKIENAKKAGANILNIHHAEDIYPFINYPYLDANVDQLKLLTNQAHEENLRLKVYYTTRELTKNLPEFWPFFSLNGEVLFPGPGNESRTEALHPNGPNQWLIDSLKENYIPAWYNLVKEGQFKGEIDLSVITTPDSRLNNFYIAGLDWMVQHIGIDGVYIDDSALDRFTLRRARKIIDRYREDGRMDLHSWNHFNSWAGYANCLNMYMDLMPYFDLVWIGEGRDYDRLPDHWLVEVSGIPFGLTGQMLQGGGNPWRGMVYGITNRAGWTSNPPSEMWKFWDDNQIQDKVLRGYWEKNCPVKCNNDWIKASIFTGAGEAIISVANWHDQDEKVTVSVDWDQLGMDPSEVDWMIPEIMDFQSGQAAVSLDNLTIPAKQGFLIVLKSKR